MIAHLRFPIGTFVFPENITDQQYQQYVADIEALPQRLELLVLPLNNTQLDTPYRPDGWTIRQVVHHLADSHINSFCRFKFALTETEPTIKPYPEELWAETPDAKTMPIEPSLQILTGLHQRWTVLLNSLNATQRQRTFKHPQHTKLFTIDIATAMYAWHSNHHLAHVQNLTTKMGW